MERLRRELHSHPDEENGGAERKLKAARIQQGEEIDGYGGPDEQKRHPHRIRRKTWRR
jgi:hypothetical protein